MRWACSGYLVASCSRSSPACCGGAAGRGERAGVTMILPSSSSVWVIRPTDPNWSRLVGVLRVSIWSAGSGVVGIIQPPRPSTASVFRSRAGVKEQVANPMRGDGGLCGWRHGDPTASSARYGVAVQAHHLVRFGPTRLVAARPWWSPPRPPPSDGGVPEGVLALATAPHRDEVPPGNGAPATTCGDRRGDGRRLTVLRPGLIGPIRSLFSIMGQRPQRAGAPTI